MLMAESGQTEVIRTWRCLDFDFDFSLQRFLWGPAEAAAAVWRVERPKLAMVKSKRNQLVLFG